MTNVGADSKISTIHVSSDDVDEEADLEKAISSTGYGTFNILLFVAALPVAWSGIFDTTTTAFILASAECDFQLTFFRKGVLVAFPYLGITITSFMWDYLTPYIGLRNLFVLSLLADTVLNVLSSAVNSYYVFLAIKFLSGVLVGGPLSMTTTYLSEFHSAKYKASFARWAGLAVNAAIIFPALAAFLILPRSWVINVFNRRYTAWRIYLLVCSTVPLLGLLTASALPQTPKYLLEIGEPKRALSLLKTMYAVNQRKPASTFPIKAVVARRDAGLSLRSFFDQSSKKIRLACYNAKLLFSGPYLRVVSLLSFLQFGSMLAFHTMRLWVPQLFIILNNFDFERWAEDRKPTMHEMLDRRMNVPARDYLDSPNFDDICIRWIIFSAVYQKSTIIAVSTVGFAFLIGTIATSKFRKKTILLTAFLLSIVSSFGVNWAYSTPYMLILSAMIIVTMRIAGNIVAAINADVIPVPLRSTSLSVLTTIGNIGAILGNFIFSALLDLQTIGPFIGLGCLLLGKSTLHFFILSFISSLRAASAVFQPAFARPSSIRTPLGHLQDLSPNRTRDDVANKHDQLFTVAIYALRTEFPVLLSSLSGVDKIAKFRSNRQISSLRFPYTTNEIPQILCTLQTELVKTTIYFSNDCFRVFTSSFPYTHDCNDNPLLAA